MFTWHMEEIGFAVALGLLAFFCIGYYRRRRNAETAEHGPEERDDSFASALAALHDRDHDWSVTFQCPWCDVENDPEYTFCRNCGGELSPDTGWSPLGALRR